MRRALTLLVLLMWLAPSLAAAQDRLAPFLGRPVSVITFEIEGRRDSSPQLLNLVDVKVGQGLRREDLRTSINRLSGRFDNVLVLVQESAGGIEVIFQLQPRHPINDIEFRMVDNSAITAGELERRFRADYGGVPTVTRVAAAENTVERMLRDDGYLHPIVRTEVVPVHNPEGATLIFNVRTGPLLNVAQIGFQNTSPLSDAAVQKGSGVRPGQPFREGQIMSAIATLQDDLRRRGFYEAIATMTHVERPGDAGVDVTLVVNAGPEVILRVVGKLPGKREDLIPVEREGSVDDDVLDAARERIKTYFKRDGYNDGDAPYTREVRPDGKLLITFTAQPGPRYRISRLDIPEDLPVPGREIQKMLGVHVGEVYSAAAIERGLTVVMAEFARLGYFESTGVPVTEFVLPGAPGDDASAIVRLDITQGPKGIVKDITFTYPEGTTGRVADVELRSKMLSTTGQPFVGTNVTADMLAVEDVYRNKGFRSVVAEITPQMNEAKTDVTLAVKIVEGPQIFIGSIVVVGNRGISEQTIRDDIPLRVGDPFSEAARVQAINTLRDRSVFRRVTIEEEPRTAGETLATVVISVEESPANNFGYGGGVEVSRRPRTNDDGSQGDTLDLAPRGFIDLGRRNIGGRNRQANFFARLSLKRRNVPGDPDRDASGLEFSEYRVNATFRERQAFRTNTDVLVGVTSEQAIRTTFSFVREAGNIDVLRRVTPRVSVSGRYALDFTRLFDERIPEDERPTIDRYFPQVRLSILSGGVLFDRTNNPLSPTHGTRSSADVEFAARKMGSEIGYSKLFLQTSAYQLLSTSQRVVVAGRVQVGVARGFQREARDPETGAPILNPDGTTQTIEDVPASQRFFAGGATSVRGFQFDRLGVPEIINANGLSVGGNAVIVLNAELRKIVGKVLGRNLSAVGFVDGGNVFAKASDLDFGRLRGAAGFGVRYDSPLGPVRLDFGFKMNRVTFTGGGRERRWEYHLSIGEAF